MHGLERPGEHPSVARVRHGPTRRGHVPKPRAQSSEAIIYGVTQIVFFVNRPGKEGSAAVIKLRKEVFGYSDE
eukprot:7039517-Prymnesium_polylepis.1